MLQINSDGEFLRNEIFAVTQLSFPEIDNVDNVKLRNENSFSSSAKKIICIFQRFLDPKPVGGERIRQQI